MIESAAVSKSGQISTASNHSDALKEAMRKAGYSILDTYMNLDAVEDFKILDYEEGFVTSLGFFVDRKLAAEIAFSCGQIKEPAEELNSAMLYTSVK